MESAYIYAFGVISGAIITLISSKSGAKIHSDGITKITEPVELPKKETPPEEPEGWDWDQYNDYVNRTEDEDGTKIR